MDRELFDPPAIIKPADALAELAGRINAEHQQAETALRAGLEHAKNAGGLLLEAKKQCGHGRWLPWLKANVRFSERAAQAYMRVAKWGAELTAKAQGTADLTIEEGLKLLTAPKDVKGIEDILRAFNSGDSNFRIEIPGFVLTPVGAEPIGEPTFEQWKEAWECIKQVYLIIQ